MREEETTESAAYSGGLRTDNVRKDGVPRYFDVPPDSSYHRVIQASQKMDPQLIAVNQADRS